MALVICGNCSNKFSDYGLVACPKCGATCGEDARAQEEEDKRQWLSWAQHIVGELKIAQSAGIDYVGIEPELRERAETVYSLVMSIPLSKWDQHSIELYRMLNGFDGRKEFYHALHLARIEDSLATIIQHCDAQTKILGSKSWVRLAHNLNPWPRKLVA